MAKISTSVTVDPELHEKLKEDESVNVSGLFNRFLKEYYEAGSINGTQFRIRRTERELEKARDRVDRLEEKLDTLRKQKAEAEERHSKRIEDVVDRLDTIPQRKLDADNPAITNQAADLPISPKELAERVRERYH